MKFYSINITKENMCFVEKWIPGHMMRRGVLACVVSHLCEYLNIASVESLPGSREVPGFYGKIWYHNRDINRNEA